MTTLMLVAMQYLNMPYRWGGDGPFEFDCSGFVLRVINDVREVSGKEPLPDMTSRDLEKLIADHSLYSANPGFRTLMFFGKGKVTHVGIGIGQDLVVEAGGAGSETLTMTKAQLISYCEKTDARVRIKSISHRQDLLAAYDISPLL